MDTATRIHCGDEHASIYLAPVHRATALSRQLIGSLGPSGFSKKAGGRMCLSDGFLEAEPRSYVPVRTGRSTPALGLFPVL